MSNSTQTFDALIQSQASKEITANAFFDAVSQASTYGRRASTSSGLTWGYYGGNVTITAGTLSQIANGTLTLTASTTCYIVALKSTGAVSFSTANTNWNDTTNYWRLYSVVTGTATVTSYTDAREMAKYSGSDSKQPLFDVDNIRIDANIISSTNSNGDINLTPNGTGFVVTPQFKCTQFSSGSPVTEVGNFSVTTVETNIICNGTADITATLPTAASFPGRELRIKNIAAFAVISASANVIPLDSATAGTAILPAVAGKWALLVSDGTNWVIMQAN